MTNLRVEKRWKALQFDVCPRFWTLGVSMSWFEDEKIFEISFCPFHLSLILDKRKQKLLSRLGYRS